MARSARVLVGVVGMVALVAAACGGGGGGSEPTPQVATLEILAGSVEVGSGATFSAGVDGQELVEGDTVRTGSDGRAGIEYFDGSITRLDHNTSFTITTLEVLDEESTSIEGEQQSGSTYHRVVELTGSSSRFTVETPTAIAAVQGTIYAVIFNPDGSITFAVVDGTVVVTSDGQSVEVPAGFMVTVDEDGTIGDVVPIPEELLTGGWIEYNQCELDAEGGCEVEAVFDHIEITPETSTIAAGDSQEYTVEAFDEDGQSMGDVTADTTISGEACADAACAPTVPGEYAITAEFMGSTATATLTVEAGAVDALEISPGAASVVAGEPQVFTAEGFDAFGNSVGPVDAAFTMVGGECSGDECSSTDVGEYTVNGSFEGASDTSTLTVTVGPLGYIIVSPSVAEIDAGGSQGYAARGYDQFGNPRGPVPATFDITDGACDGVDCGSTVAGAQTVTGVYAGRADTAILNVNPGPLESIAISPEDSTILAGETQEYTTEGIDEYGNSTGEVDAEYSISTVEALYGTSGGPLAAAYGEIPWFCDGNECGSTSVGFFEVESTFDEYTVSASLEVDPGPAADIALYTFVPIDFYEACPLSASASAYIVDAYGNVVDSNATVTFADTDGDASNVSFDPSASVAASGGYASVDIVPEAAGPVSLQASSGALTSNVATFDVLAGCGLGLAAPPPFGGAGAGPLTGFGLMLAGVLAAMAVLRRRPTPVGGIA